MTYKSWAQLVDVLSPQQPYACLHFGLKNCVSRVISIEAPHVRNTRLERGGDSLSNVR